MKLLLDQNLSPRLVNRLASVYLDMSHVALVGLDRASDAEVWEYARANDYIIETKDSDFNDISLLRGAPPQIIWLRLGNCTTDAVEQVLRRGYAQIAAFAGENTRNILELI